MSQYHLEKYLNGGRNRYECPRCHAQRCFTRYVNERGEYELPPEVGRCDHESSCGYHYPPREYFADHPQAGNREWKTSITTSKPMILPPPKPTDYIDFAEVVKSFSDYGNNPFAYWLYDIFGNDEALRLVSMYAVGTSPHWGGSTIFWQIDEQMRVHAGKVMLYDRKTGKRVKAPHNHVTWAHSILWPGREFNMRQCLFGAHMLPSHPDMLVMLVESEKTAIICAHFMPQYLWLATGGKHGCFNREAMAALRGRDVTLIPDLGCEDEWRRKAELYLDGVAASWRVSDVLSSRATDDQRAQGLDLADFLLAEPTDEMILADMIARHPQLRQFIDDLQLTLVKE